MISLRSKITKELLNYFFLNPEQELYVNEIERKLGLDKRNLIKKLRELEQDGILKSKEQGNLKYYSINCSYHLYDEYKKIIFKTLGLQKRLKDCLSRVGGVKQVYLFGSYANDQMGSHSDIDLLVVGEHKVLKLQSEINRLQQEIDREINIVNMSEQEFLERRKNKDDFLENIFNEKYIEVM